MLKKKKQKEKITSHQADEAAKALEALFAAGYVDKHKLYMANFVRGIFFSVGSIVGATIIIALLLWILSLFDQVPIIGPFFDSLKDTVQNGT